jgi:hypothetical protein
MVFWKYPDSLPVEVGCGVSQGKVSFRSAAFRASRTRRGLIKNSEMRRLAANCGSLGASLGLSPHVADQRKGDDFISPSSAPLSAEKRQSR